MRSRSNDVPRAEMYATRYGDTDAARKLYAGLGAAAHPRPMRLWYTHRRVRRTGPPIRMRQSMPQQLRAALVGLQRDEVVGLIEGSIAEGEDPRAILEECRQGMSLVGARFQAGEYYLAELLLSAEIFKTAVALLEPHLERAHESEPAGTVVLATMQGDIHDLGKNIFATLLRAQAFEVHDLGVDVAPLLLLEKVKELRPNFVGLSALLTTTFPSMKQVTEMLQAAGLRDELKVLVGGGVTTAALKEYVGADFQTADAIEGVAYCLRAVGERGAR